MDIDIPAQLFGCVMPAVQIISGDVERKTVGEQGLGAFKTLRKVQSDKKFRGVREQRAKARAEEEAQKKK